MARTRLDGGADVTWNVVDSRAEIIQELADALNGENGRHYATRQAAWHITNDAKEVRKLNHEHLRGYDASADDLMHPHLDRIGQLLSDREFAASIPASHLGIMRAAVAAIRGALFSRASQHRQEVQREQRQATN